MGTKPLRLHLLCFSENRIHFAEIHGIISIGITLYCTCDNIPLFRIILIIENFPLLFANLLHHNLFRLLSGDPTEILRCHLNAYNRPYLCHIVSRLSLCQRHLKRIILYLFYYLFVLINMEFSRYIIKTHPDIIRLAKLILTCRQQGIFNRFQ